MRSNFRYLKWINNQKGILAILVCHIWNSALVSIWMHSKRQLKYSIQTNSHTHVRCMFTVRCITTNKIEKNYFLMRFDLLLCDFVSKILIIFIENIIDLLLLKWKTGIIDSNVFPSPRSPHIDFNFSLSDFSALGLGFAWLRFGLVSIHYIYCHINSYLRENSNNTIWYSTSYCHI